MNYINLQKQSPRSKDSNTTTAGFKGVPRLLCLSNGSSCYAGYLAKNGSVALSSKSRMHSVFNFSACRYLACITTKHFMSQARQTRHFARDARRGDKKKKSACNQPIALTLPLTYAHKYWLTAVMSKGPMKTRSIARKLSPFWVPMQKRRQQHKP